MTSGQRGAGRSPDTAIFVGLLLLLLWLPLPWGSNTAGGIAVFGLSCGLLTMAWSLLWLRGRVRPPALDALPALALCLWGLWILWVGAQIVPLPPDLLQRISPQAAATHAVLGDNALYTISIAPGQTLQQLMLSLAYVSLFWLTLCTLRRNGRLRWFLGAILASATLQALYGAVMTLTGIEYGFLRPKEHGIGWATGTFVNRNHFASYLHLGLAAGIGLILSWGSTYSARDWKDLVRRLINTAFSPTMTVRVALVVGVIALVLTQSRMGNVAFFTALVGCGTVWLVLRNYRWLGKGLIFFLSILVIDVWIVSNWFGLDRVIDRLEQTDLAHEQRMVVLSDIEPLIRANLSTGTGLGSFEHAFAPYRHEFLGHFNHAHNEPAQFLVETGVVGVLLLSSVMALLLLHSLRIMRKRRDNAIAAMAFVALMASTSLLMHSTVEFNLRIPAIAATLMAILGAMAGMSCRSRKVRRRPGHSQAASAELHSKAM